MDHHGRSAFNYLIHIKYLLQLFKLKTIKIKKYIIIINSSSSRSSNSIQPLNNGRQLSWLSGYGRRFLITWVSHHCSDTCSNTTQTAHGGQSVFFLQRSPVLAPLTHLTRLNLIEGP